MDLTTLWGIGLALIALLTAAIIEGTSLISLLNPSAFILVVGGTIGATMASYPMSQLKAVIPALKLAFSKENLTIKELIDVFVNLSERARQEGLLSLENNPPQIDHPMLQRGIRMVVDGTDPETIRTMLEGEIMTDEAKMKTHASIFATAGGYAPTMGIIGTVMGLVKVLGSLENSAELGPAIATAFIATFYGISTANIIFLPIAKKLTQRAKESSLLKEVIMEGLLSLQAGDRPHLVQEKLALYLEDRSELESGEGTEASASSGYGSDAQDQYGG